MLLAPKYHGWENWVSRAWEHTSESMGKKILERGLMRQVKNCYAAERRREMALGLFSQGVYIILLQEKITSGGKEPAGK